MPLGEDYEDSRNIRKPFINNNNAGSGSFFVVLCVLVVALGPIQFGFTVLIGCVLHLLYFHTSLLHVFHENCFLFIYICLYSVVILHQRKRRWFVILIYQFQGYLFNWVSFIFQDFELRTSITNFFLNILLDSFHYLDLYLMWVQWWEQQSVVI